MKKRIWELDALRGLFILGVIVVHFIYDLTDLYGIIDWDAPELFLLVKNYGGILFFLISGISVTLGSHSVRRGLIAIGCGMVISAVTYGMYRFGFADKSILIYFGVLHCLGTCMLLWPLHKNTPWWGLLILGVILVVLGFYLKDLMNMGELYIGNNYLAPLGLHRRDFFTSDYFPLLPHFGFFLVGSALGKSIYRKKETLLPILDSQHFLIRFLVRPAVRFWSFCGRHSLLIYLAHQPLLNGICYLIILL